MAAYGPKNWLEVSVGGVFGYEKSEQENTAFSYALPLVQGKFCSGNMNPEKGRDLERW
jgi:hypothetical protein